MKQLAFIIVAATLLFVSCRSEVSTQSADVSVPVKVSEVGRKPIYNTLTINGTVKPTGSVELSTETEGYYHLNKNPRTGQPYKMGDIVKKGEKIITLENEEYLLSIRIDTKKLDMENAKQELEKQQSLYDKGGVTQRELKNVEVSYLNSKYDYENAQFQSNKLFVLAPLDGVIVSLPFVTDRAKLNSGTKALKVMEYATLLLNVQFPEKFISTITIGQEAFITNYNLKDDTLKAVVTELSPAISETTRTFDGVMKVSNPELKMRPGMFVKADIVIERHDSAVVISREIIQNRRGGKIVFVIDKNAAQERRIRTGIETDKEVEVVSGLIPGDQLVTEGYEMLSNRTKVKVQK